jgi:hypothetical protein
MPDTLSTHEARLDEIRLELARQNDMLAKLAKLAPELTRSTSARSPVRAPVHLYVRRV